MKIAITAQGDSLESPIDPRFGRAGYILIVNPDTLQFEVINNRENVNRLKGAGIQAATMIHDKGADILVTGYCGPNAFKTLSAVQIKVATNISGTVLDALEVFRQGNLSFSDEANAEGHWV